MAAGRTTERLPIPVPLITACADTGVRRGRQQCSFFEARLIRRSRPSHYSREKALYEWTGFPQEVQGKHGENWGESVDYSKLFIIIGIRYN